MVELEIRSVAGFGRYEIEGPGMYLGDELALNMFQDGFEYDDVHKLTLTLWPQAVYTSRTCHCPFNLSVLFEVVDLDLRTFFFKYIACMPR